MSPALEKKAPQRSCIACGKQAQKAELFRLVRSEEGRVAFDASGKARGRGAYVCSTGCLERAFKSKRIDRALRTSTARADFEQICIALPDSLQVI